MTADEARYYRASRAARAAWEATQPQLTLTECRPSIGSESIGGSVSARAVYDRVDRAGEVGSLSGLDDGPLTADGETPYSPSGPNPLWERGRGPSSNPQGKGI